MPLTFNGIYVEIQTGGNLSLISSIQYTVVHCNCRYHAYIHKRGDTFKQMQLMFYNRASSSNNISSTRFNGDSCKEDQPPFSGSIVSLRKNEMRLKGDIDIGVTRPYVRLGRQAEIIFLTKSRLEEDITWTKKGQIKYE